MASDHPCHITTVPATAPAGKSTHMLSPPSLLHCAFIMFSRNGTSVPMPAYPRLKEVSKVFRVGMPKKEAEDTPTILAVQQ